MQKALILALLIGAFLLPFYSNSEDTPAIQCPVGGSYNETLQTCAVAVTPEDIKTGSCGGKYAAATIVSGKTNEELYSKCRAYGRSQISSQKCIKNEIDTSTGISFWQGIDHAQPGTSCSSTILDGPYNIFVSNIKTENLASCPPDSAPDYTGSAQSGGTTYCIAAPITEPCDDPLGNCDPDEPEPPECDDIVGNCTPPEEDQQCFRGGAGQLVCFEDPNDKCDVNSVNGEPVYSNCQSGCGFVQGNFLCSETPDIPSLDKCLVTTNGYACPPDIPAPDDDIDTPEKPIDNMVKNDFKDVLKGVETRIDANNQLLADQIARDKENTDAINAGQGQSNAYLKQIDLNTKKIADTLEGSLEGDGVEFNNNDRADITSALGITGDESIDDLTVGEVTLDEFRSDFNWSIGSAQCPQPRQINMLGKTFYMEWEPFCQAFNVIGYFILAAAYFFATLIAFKGK